MDALNLLGAALAFGLLITAHVVLAASLAIERRPRWRGLVALLVPPLAPYWGMEERMRLRSALWLGAAAAYVVALALVAR